MRLRPVRRLIPNAFANSLTHQTADTRRPGLVQLRGKSRALPAQRAQGQPPVGSQMRIESVSLADAQPAGDLRGDAQREAVAPSCDLNVHNNTECGYVSVST